MRRIRYRTAKVPIANASPSAPAPGNIRLAGEGLVLRRRRCCRKPSLTLYNEYHFFAHNAPKPYALGTKNKTLKYNADGSLTIYAGAKSPVVGASRVAYAFLVHVPSDKGHNRTLGHEV